MISPLANSKNRFDGLNQLMYGDAVYIKDFTQLEKMTKEQLLKYATILHDFYQSFDLLTCPISS